MNRGIQGGGKAKKWAMFRIRRAVTVLLIPGMIFLLSACGESGLTITGSETMYPMLRALAADFNATQDALDVHVQGGGSIAGLKELINEEADFAASSLYFEHEAIQQLHYIDDFELALLSFDGISIVVNRDKPVKKLTLKQLSGIFSGQIKNWQEVGGPDMPIMVITRNEESGTTAFMLENVVRMKKLGELVYHTHQHLKLRADKIAANNREIASLIQKHKNAVSYMGMGSTRTEGRGKVDCVAVALHEEGPFLEPTVESIEKQNYKLSRPLMLVYRPDEKKDEKQAFLDYLKTKRAKALVEEKGYQDSLYSHLMLKTLIIKGKRLVEKESFSEQE